ncbi:MAG: hypothetical protein WCK96_03295 [Methylococcales bacterium]
MGKGGVGKTILAAAIAVELAHRAYLPYLHTVGGFMHQRLLTSLFFVDSE